LETALSVSTTPSVTLLLRLGEVYMKLQKYEKSMNTYMNAAELWPSCISWLGVGISYFRLGDLDHAEQSLNEANIQNNRNADVWGYLALISLHNKKEKEAERCLRESLKQGLKTSNPALVDEISSVLSQTKLKINI